MTKKTLFLFSAAVALSLSAAAADPKDARAGAPGATAARPASQGDGYQLLLRRATPLKRVDVSACSAPAGGSCVISVTVGDKCNIRVSPEYLIVRTKGEVTLLWKLAPASWAFDEARGIEFKRKSEQFADGRRLAKQVWQWKDRNTERGYHAYNVNIVNDKGERCSIDPGVWNGEPTP